MAGVVIARITPADDPDAQTVLGPWRRGPPWLATWSCTSTSSPSHQASGAAVSRRGCSRAPNRGLALGARAAFAFGWLPAGRPEPDAVPFYEAAGYAAGADLVDFFAQGSVESGAHCPYCGDPPCRCAVRPFVKGLAPGAADTPAGQRPGSVRLCASRPQRSQLSGDHVRRLAAHSGSSRHTNVSFCRSRSAICSSSLVFMTNGP